LTPEARARHSIDALLIAAGWAVHDLKPSRIVIETETEFEVDTSLLRTLALRLAA
jgi:hypothetical protein